MITGSVRWFDDTNGFGFITPDDGSEDLFVHISTVNMSGFNSLKEKQKVCFDVVHGTDGEQASNINSSFVGQMPTYILSADWHDLSTCEATITNGQLSGCAGLMKKGWQYLMT